MTLSPAPVPEQEGLTQEWVSVQKVATKAMEKAGARALIHAENESYEEDARDVWAAMLAASPTPPAGRKALETTAQRYLDAVAFLGTHYTPDKRSFFEASPSKDEGVLEAWQELNDAGVALKAALAAGGAA